jgi:hypothetical protein
VTPTVAGSRRIGGAYWRWQLEEGRRYHEVEDQSRWCGRADDGPTSCTLSDVRIDEWEAEGSYRASM